MRENSRLTFMPAIFWLVISLTSSAAFAVPSEPPEVDCDPPDSCITGGSGDEPYALGAVPFNYSWPAEPNTTRSETVTTMAALRSAVARDGNRITIPASFGTQSGSITVTGNDVDIIMSNSATINGSIQIGNFANRATRVRWTGGNMNGGPFQLDNADDFMLNDFHGITNGSENNWTGGGGTGVGARRVAAINTTLEVVNSGSGNEWAIFVAPAPNQDWIFANVKLISDGQNNRFQGVSNLIIVDSIFNPDHGSSNSFRTHIDCTNVYVRDTILGLGGWLANGMSGNYGIVNGTFERVTKYSTITAFITDFEQTGTFNDGQLLSTAGTPGQPAGIGGFSGSNNRIVGWDGSSRPDGSRYGANR